MQIVALIGGKVVTDGLTDFGQRYKPKHEIDGHVR